MLLTEGRVQFQTCTIIDVYSFKHAQSVRVRGHTVAVSAILTSFSHSSFAHNRSPGDKRSRQGEMVTPSPLGFVLGVTGTVTTTAEADVGPGDGDWNLILLGDS